MQVDDRRVAQDLIEREAWLLRDLAGPSARWKYTRAGRSTTSRASFELALSMPGVVTATALLRLYAGTVSLSARDGWSMSALPTYVKNGETRFTTVSHGQMETFFVWVSIDAGQVTRWGLRFTDPALSFPPELSPVVNRYGAADIMGTSVEDLARALREPTIRDASTSLFDKPATRRALWHNPYLAALTGAETTADVPARSESSVRDEVERGYVLRTIRRRTHQRAFRELLLASYARQCYYCGTDTAAILQAAHLIPDRDQGPASVDNGRLLCANHHAAFDAGLLTWDGAKFVPAPHAPLVPPLPGGAHHRV